MSKLKTIDLTPIVGSRVLCEFWDAANPIDSVSVGFLSGIDVFGLQTMYQPEMRQRYYNNCRIYHHPDYWISNADGKLVLPDGLEFNAISRNGGTFSSYEIGGKYNIFEHEWLAPPRDIMAVQVTGPAVGYQWSA